MKNHKMFCFLFLIFSAIFFVVPANAVDLYLNSPLETDYYQSDGTIFAQDGCVIPQAKNVRFLAQSGITLEPGFRVQSGSTFAATIGDYTDVAADADIDADDLPDSWELANFGNISQPRDGDYDGDGHSNFAEYNLETNPADGNDAPDPDDYD